MVVKLKTLKQDHKVWNKDVFGNVSTKKLEALVELGLWDAKEREKTLTTEKYEVKIGEVNEFQKWAVLEKILWRQKSRELWLKEKDKNIRFFHKMANAQRRNFLDNLRVNGDLLEGVANAFRCFLRWGSGDRV